MKYIPDIKNMLICFVSIVCLTLVGCSDTSSYAPSMDTNSFDYKYSKTRFKMEGYSDKDSDTAAKAIMKFNQAQQNRRR